MKAANVTDDLASYLLARFDADAAGANEVHNFDCRAHSVDITGYEFILAECDCSEPARVLAEVEAKRRIVAEYLALRKQADVALSHYSDWLEGRRLQEPTPPSSMHDRAVLQAQEHVLRLLSQPYADREDFRDEWRV